MLQSGWFQGSHSHLRQSKCHNVLSSTATYGPTTKSRWTAWFRGSSHWFFSEKKKTTKSASCRFSPPLINLGPTSFIEINASHGAGTAQIVGADPSEMPRNPPYHFPTRVSSRFISANPRRPLSSLDFAEKSNPKTSKKKLQECRASEGHPIIHENPLVIHASGSMPRSVFYS